MDVCSLYSLEPYASPLEELSVSALEELSASALEELSASALEELSASALEELSASVLEELSASVLEELSASVPEELSASALQELSASALEELTEVPGSVLRAHRSRHIATAHPATFPPPSYILRATVVCTSRTRGNQSRGSSQNRRRKKTS